MYTDYSFLKQNSDFKYILDMAQVLNSFIYLQEIQKYNQSITNIDGEFLPLALKALDLSSVVFFLQDGKTFFEQFRFITTYDGFCGILKSLFLSNDIQITLKEPAVIDIVVTNKNETLVSNYVDIDEKLYKDTNKYYVGFRSDASSSLEAFFKRFLERFLPAGVVLNSITINSFAKLQVESQQNKLKTMFNKIKGIFND